MTIKSLFHVQSRSIRPTPKPEPSHEPLDIAVEWEDARPVRGVSEQSWHRARGWSTED